MNIYWIPLHAKRYAKNSENLSYLTLTKITTWWACIMPDSLFSKFSGQGFIYSDAPANTAHIKYL